MTWYWCLRDPMTALGLQIKNYPGPRGFLSLWRKYIMHLSIVTSTSRGGEEFDRLYTTSEEKMLSDLADKILRSWPNGWPKMGRMALLNVNMKFFYPILIWKRPSSTYILWCIDLKRSCPVKCLKKWPGVGHLPIQQVLHGGHLNSISDLTFLRDMG